MEYFEMFLWGMSIVAMSLFTPIWVYIEDSINDVLFSRGKK